ncbi:MAG: DUF2085 domain-containing protein, partial [Chloroflexota bacterium]
RRRAFDRAFTNLVVGGQLWVADHWLLFLNAAVAVYVGLAVLSPVLLANGQEAAGQFLFQAYRYACHQYPQRSYFIAGHQVAFCERDTAIYVTFLLAGLAYAGRRGRVRPLRWWAYALLIAPMAVDGTGQLFGLWESNWELRTVTGALFAGATVWFLYPYIDRTVEEMRRDALEMLARQWEGEDAKRGSP